MLEPKLQSDHVGVEYAEGIDEQFLAGFVAFEDDDRWSRHRSSLSALAFREACVQVAHTLRTGVLLGRENV
jgi:hypothetical protein